MGKRSDGGVFSVQCAEIFGEWDFFFPEPLDFFRLRCYNKDNHAAKDRNPTGLSFM